MGVASSLHQHPYPQPHTISFISWAKTPGGFIKINFDKSKFHSIVARCFIVRSWDERFNQAGYTNLGTTLLLVAEAIVMCNGVATATQAGYRLLVLEQDNQVLITALIGELEIPWEDHTLVEDTCIIISCTTVFIQHIFRDLYISSSIM